MEIFAINAMDKARRFTSDSFINVNTRLLKTIV